MKRYSTLHRSPKLKPHHQQQFDIIFRTPLFAGVLLFSRKYSQGTLSPAYRVKLFHLGWVSFANLISFSAQDLEGEREKDIPHMHNKRKLIKFLTNFNVIHNSMKFDLEKLTQIFRYFKIY